MHIILILLFLFIFFVFFVPTVIISVISKILSLFGLGQKRRKVSEEHRANDAAVHNISAKNSKNKKIFDKNEGEYVDFEEIK